MKLSAAGWHFSRTGGVDQVVLRTGEDIGNLASLDPKLWAVLAMPTDQPKLAECLRALDGDSDGKVRVPDILSGVEELKSGLKSLDLLFERGDSLSIDQVLGEKAASTIAYLFSEGRAPASAGRVALGEVDEAIAVFSSLPFNGDGVLDPDSMGEAGAADLARKIVAAGFSAGDSAGKQGLSAETLDAFLAAAAARLAWLKAEPSAEAFGLPREGRKAAWGLYGRLKPRVDDYFRRCSLLAMSGSAAAAAELEKVLAAIVAGGEDKAGDEGLAALPLAMPRPALVLPWDGSINPRDAADLAAFRKASSEAFGLGSGLAQADWEALKLAFEAFGSWLGSEPWPSLSGFDATGLEAVLSGAEIGVLRGLIEKDAAMASTADGLKALRRLLLLKRDFLAVLRNFVNLDEFYAGKDGCFRAGRLYLDGRELEFCLEVKNPGNHVTMANLSAMYLIYCNLTNHLGQQKSIVATLTAGDGDNVFPGRNGVFYDSEGKDWDAVITRVVVQPIGIKEAFFSPYKWFAKSLEDFAVKRAATAEAASMDKMKSAALATANADKAPPKPDLVPKKMDVGTVAAIGVALGSIGGMVTSILGIFFGMKAWAPLGIVGVLLLISGPSMILAYMKLRKRNIGPLLNAEGWAVNGRLKINVPFGATLSHLAVLPPGATRQIVDPFAEKKRPWGLYLVVLLVLGAAAAAFFLGWLDPIFGW